MCDKNRHRPFEVLFGEIFFDIFQNLRDFVNVTENNTKSKRMIFSIATLPIWKFQMRSLQSTSYEVFCTFVYADYARTYSINIMVLLQFLTNALLTFIFLFLLFLR